MILFLAITLIPTIVIIILSFQMSKTSRELDEEIRRMKKENNELKKIL